MNNITSGTPGFDRPRSIRRRAFTLAQEELVRESELQPGVALPLLIQPCLKGVDLIEWARGNKAHIEARLLQHGAILFRNFDVKGAADFEKFIQTAAGQLLQYKERSSPRSEVSGNIYTSTDYPMHYSIFLHNENSYQKSWPLKIFFFCETPAEQGGETPLADCRKVYARLSPQLKERFIQKKWMYVRNFGGGFGLPWQDVFRTTDRQVVEEHCRRADIKAEWKNGNQLRVSAVRPAVRTHPALNETVWFNHATFFHVTTLEPTVREELMRGLREEEFPTNTYYGDGSPIEPSVLEELREAYKQEETSFLWERGDILMVDNMLVAHGRAPFLGARKILVGMTEPVSSSDF